MTLFDKLFKKIDSYHYDISYDKSLIKNSKSSVYIDDIEFVERININALAFLLQNLEKVQSLYREDAHNQVSLNKYYDKWDSEEKGVKVKYTQTTELNGRQQAIGGLSAQGMVREARNFSFIDNYVDVDMSSAHPNIINWICENLNAELADANVASGGKFDIKIDVLKEYIENKDKKLEEIKIKLCEAGLNWDKSDVKTYILKVMYGCGDKEINKIPLEIRNGFLNNLIEELNQISHKLFYILKPVSEKNIIRRKQKKKDYNMEASTMSHICQYVENALLMKMFNILYTLDEEKSLNCILCFDGIMIPKEIFTVNYNVDSYLKECQKEINEMGFKSFKLEIKEMKLAKQIQEELETKFSIKYDKTVNYVKQYEDKQRKDRLKKLNNLKRLNKDCNFYNGPVYNKNYLWDHEENLKEDFLEFNLIYGKVLESICIENEKYNVNKTRIYYEDFRDKICNTRWDSMLEASLFFQAYSNRFMGYCKTCPDFFITNSSSGISYQKLEKKKIRIKDENGDYKPIPFKSLVENIDCINNLKHYEAMVFKPYTNYDNNAIVKINELNMFGGFRARLLPESAVRGNTVLEEDKEVINLILSHIRIVLANEEEESYKFIISWFHKLCKTPSQKTKKVMVFQSTEHQIGKGLFLNSFFGKYVMGEKLYSVHNGLGCLADKFNSCFENSLYNVIEEVRNVDTNKNKDDVFNSLKTFATEDKIKIERKGVDSYQADNYCNFIANTNSNVPVKIEEGNARIALFKCNGRYHGNKEYIQNFVKKCLNSHSANLFYSYLYWMKDDEVIDVSIVGEVKTELQMEIKRLTQSAPIKFLQEIKEMLDDQTFEDAYKRANLDNKSSIWLLPFANSDKKHVYRIKKPEFYEAFKSWCQINGEYTKSKTHFYQDIKDKIKIIKDNIIYVQYDSIELA
jgi:hypothetical protein